MNKTATIATITGIISFAGGLVMGFHTAATTVRKKLNSTKKEHEVKANDDSSNSVTVQFANGDETEITTEVELDAEYDDILDDYSAKEEVVEDEKTIRKVKSFPYIIDDDEWEKKNGFAKRILSFYRGDGVLVDEEGEEIDNWRELVGNEPLSKMEIYGTQIQYVRNEKRKEDYEINLIDNFFEKDDGR